MSYKRTQNLGAIEDFPDRRMSSMNLLCLKTFAEPKVMVIRVFVKGTRNWNFEAFGVAILLEAASKENPFEAQASDAHT
ncbi:MAG: hypothetical protein M1825_003700 [Sarcosagium campestre]|nr:MAG: hypothetical protein M1825_003700 [Sarcosagium campestre]